MPVVNFNEIARFKASSEFLSDVRNAAARENQTMSEYIRSSLRERLRAMRDDDFNGDGPTPMAA